MRQFRPARQFSPYEMFLARAREHEPRYAFTPGMDFIAWRQAALNAVIATLGLLPERVDPQAELVAEWDHGVVRRQRWVLQVERELSGVAYVNRPAELSHDGRAPAIMCWHGHGGDGKGPVMGDSVSGAGPAGRGPVTDYGFRMAEAGFVTFAMDWMGNGDLRDAVKPNHRDMAGGRDWCNLYYLHATMLGMTPLGINLAHGLALVDWAATLPFVDPGRLGVMGLSGGGTMALWSALVDSRLRAIEIICYSDLFADFAYRDFNYCGSQVTPELFTLVDVPELQGLLAPRPLLVDIGAYDTCFRVESAMACYTRVREIYEAAGAEDLMHLNLFPAGHEWEGSKSNVFFSESLRPAANEENSEITHG